VDDATLARIRQHVSSRPVLDWMDGLVTVDVPDFDALCTAVRDANARNRELEEEVAYLRKHMERAGHILEDALMPRRVLS
jgi:hypothetical protein